jgi:hypothetical protein
MIKYLLAAADPESDYSLGMDEAAHRIRRALGDP